MRHSAITNSIYSSQVLSGAEPDRFFSFHISALSSLSHVSHNPSGYTPGSHLHDFELPSSPPASQICIGEDHWRGEMHRRALGAWWEGSGGGGGGGDPERSDLRGWNLDRFAELRRVASMAIQGWAATDAVEATRTSTVSPLADAFVPLSHSSPMFGQSATTTDGSRAQGQPQETVRPLLSSAVRELVSTSEGGEVVLEWGVEGLQDEPVALLSAASVPSKDVPCVPGHERERAPSAEASTVACADGALGPTASQAPTPNEELELLLGRATSPVLPSPSGPPRAANPAEEMELLLSRATSSAPAPPAQPRAPTPNEELEHLLGRSTASVLSSPAQPRASTPTEELELLLGRATTSPCPAVPPRVGSPVFAVANQARPSTPSGPGRMVRGSETSSPRVSLQTTHRSSGEGYATLLEPAPRRELHQLPTGDTLGNSSSDGSPINKES